MPEEIRETSRQAWNEIKGSSLKSDCMRSIVDTLANHGPLTAREICDYADRNGLWKRLSEMERMGLIEEKDKRKCSVTGRKAIVWKLSE